jgi:hypothetical protein
MRSWSYFHIACFMALQIVFSKAWWVGRKEDNPEEKQLPMPLALQQDKQHEAYDYDFGAGSHAAADGSDQGAGKATPGAAAAGEGSLLGVSPGPEVLMLDGEDEPEVGNFLGWSKCEVGQYCNLFRVVMPGVEHEMKEPYKCSLMYPTGQTCSRLIRMWWSLASCASLLSFCRGFPPA